MAAATTQPRREFTVSQFIQRIRRNVSATPELRGQWVRGELSKEPRPWQDRVYFTLKDGQSTLDGYLTSEAVRSLSSPLTAGEEIICFGNATVQLKEGRCLLEVEQVERIGEGELLRQFLLLKDRLLAEGLFDQRHKKPLPKYARRIGLITSMRGAVFSDVVKVSGQRAPWTQVILFDTLVQGNGAVTSIRRALEAAIHFPALDVLIIGRGGGSLEDLWAFNDEALTRDLFACHLPVVSAVGHEVDTTLVDFVADCRASTPSDAALLCTPDGSALRRHLTELQMAARRGVDGRIELWRERLDGLIARSVLERPDLFVSTRREDVRAEWSRASELTRLLLDTWAERLRSHERVLLARRPSAVLAERRSAVVGLGGRLSAKQRARLHELGQEVATCGRAVRLRHPRTLIDHRAQQLGQLKSRLDRAAPAMIERSAVAVADLQRRMALRSPALKLPTLRRELVSEQRALSRSVGHCLQIASGKATSLKMALYHASPYRALDKGYVLVHRGDGVPVGKAKDLVLGEHVQLKMADGHVGVIVDSVSREDYHGEDN